MRLTKSMTLAGWIFAGSRQVYVWTDGIVYVYSRDGAATPHPSDELCVLDAALVSQIVSLA